MITKPPYVLALSCVLALAIAFPGDILAAPQTTGQRAGEVSKLIPAVNIARGSQSLAASAKFAVNWQDVVNTQANARARLSLDDGSVLNIGSDSSVRVAKHDAGAQQTDLEIGFGKMRSKAQKIPQPNGKFEVHTPAGVAGVVGTDFYVGYENNVMTVIVFEGIVRVCNLAGVCVVVNAGQMTTLRNGDPSGPVPPVATPPGTGSDAISKTNPDGRTPGTDQVPPIRKGTAITTGILAIIPAVVIPIVATRSQGTPAPQSTCKPGTANCG